MNERELARRQAKRRAIARRRKICFGFAALAVVIAILNLRGLQKIARYAPQAARGVLPGGVKRVAVTDPIAAKIVKATQAQIGTHYDASYRIISYPLGDVDSSKGACTDVVIRALRGAGYDLQKLIHQDMSKNFHLYPRQWGLQKPDKNIDHRRVPNQMTYFSRFGQTLTLLVNGSTLKDWKPGDIVCWDMGNSHLHTGVLSDGVNEAGVPLVIHNGWMCVEDDSLTRWKIIGHYRYPKSRSH
jgi:uncharacterized protein YijF (DUF1287 family)